MSVTRTLLIALLLLLPSPFVRAHDQPTTEVKVQRCLITSYCEVEVPAREAGVIAKLHVREGSQVTQGDTVAELGSQQAELERKHAHHEWQMAAKQSEQDLDVQAAQAAKELAKANLAAAEKANSILADSVSGIEVHQLRAEAKRASIEVQVAERDGEVARIKTQDRQVMLRLAEHKLAKHQIQSPIKGMVVELFHEQGEWVNPGDPVCRILHLEKLCVEGFVNADDYTLQEVIGKSVRVEVQLPRARQTEVTGRITFASPEIDPVNRQFRVLAEVKNPETLLSPGLSAQMTIRLNARNEAATLSAK